MAWPMWRNWRAISYRIPYRGQYWPALLAKGNDVYLAIYYVVAIAILVLHFTGHLARYRMEWLVLVLAISVFPAVIYL